MSCLPFPAAGEGQASHPAVKLPPMWVPQKSETPVTTHHPMSVAPGLLTYGGNEGCVEGVVREAEQHTGLPHARISDQKQLEQQVVRLLRH